MTMSDSCTNDFVDYFFQKEGDTFISQLLKLREDYTAKRFQALSRASQATRSGYNDFTARLLAPDKILPQIYRVEHFDFDKALASVFENLDLDVTDTLEMIAKYYEFISNLQSHWKGLELEPSTVIETSIQLMATLESMVYPLFLKLTNYIGCTAGKACSPGPTNPEMMMCRLHKLAEALAMEIATIGSSGVVTLGQCPCSTRESILCDSAKLGIQSRSAKNCISWALQAVAPSLQFYYLQTKCCDNGASTVSQGCPCPQAAAANGCTNQTQTCPGDLRAEQRSQVAVKGCGGLREESRQDENLDKAEEDEDDTTAKKEKKDAQIQAKDNRFVTTATAKVQVDEETEGTVTEDQDDEDASESESAASVAASQSGASVAASESNASVAEEESETDNADKVTDDDVQDFQTATRDNNEQKLENDFVSYFFKKNGIKYVAILTQTRKKYEERCKALIKENPNWKRSALSYMDTVHDARKLSPPTIEVPEVEDINFVALLTNAVSDFDIDVQDKLSLINSYEDYTKGMFRHWRYQIEHDKPLTADTVVDVGIQMMATTMALVYPIFIRIAEFLRKLSKSEERDKYTPEGLAAKLHILVEITARQMTSIGTSCGIIIAAIPNIPNLEIDEQQAVLDSQVTLAKNSVTWAMKSISPLLLLYYIKIMEAAKNEKSETSISGRSPQKEGSTVQSTQSLQRLESNASRLGLGVDEEKLTKARKFYKAPAQSKNLVFYFYEKEGREYSSILTHLRTQYEGLVLTAMDNAEQSVKDQVQDFVGKYHEARKATFPKEDVDLRDVMFKEAVAKIFEGFEINIQDNLATLVKYSEFSKNVETHWNYRITKDLELDQDAVLEMSVEMMGTTVALAYPIFIKIAEYVVEILKNHALSTDRLAPYDLISRLRKFVILVTIELAAIGMTCSGIMAKLPNANQDEVSARATKLEDETKTADGAISWAMKAVFPVIMLYFLQFSHNSVTGE